MPDKNGEDLTTRLLTVEEVARLIDSPEGYRLPGSYNDGYKAMGDAVALPVVHYLAEHLLAPLCKLANSSVSPVPGEKEATVNAKEMNLPIEAELESFAKKHGFRGKGALSVALAVTRKAEKQGLPLDPEELLTEGGGQVQGLGKATVQSILKEYGIDRVLAEEAGRTSRGSISKMRTYVAFLNKLHDQSRVDLNAVDAWWIEKVRGFFSGQPFRLKIDPSKSLRSIISELLEQALKRQRETPGVTYAGTVLQHLVGAKLELMLGEGALTHYGASVADAPSHREGDFLVSGAAIHVTTAPTEALVRKCERNLDAGLRPIIVTTQNGAQGAEAFVKGTGSEGRIDFFEITQFVAANLYERSGFITTERLGTVQEFVRIYNSIVEKHESDPSLRIEMAR